MLLQKSANFFCAEAYFCFSGVKNAACGDDQRRTRKLNRRLRRLKIWCAIFVNQLCRKSQHHLRDLYNKCEIREKIQWQAVQPKLFFLIFARKNFIIRLWYHLLQTRL